MCIQKTKRDNTLFSKVKSYLLKTQSNTLTINMTLIDRRNLHLNWLYKISYSIVVLQS